MKKCITIVLLLLLCPLCAMADTIYVIATPITDSTETATEPTAFGQTIDAARFEKRFSTTGEVLRQAAGANVRSIGGLGSYSTVSLRGAGSNQCLVLVDGLRISPPSGGGTDLSKIPLADVETIEIIRGSDSALFGENAMGGVVNIVTKDPGEKLRADTSLTCGSWNTRDIHAGISGKLFGETGASLNFSSRHSDNDYEFENNNGTELDESDDFDDKRRNNELDDTSVMAKITSNPGYFRLKAAFSHIDAKKDQPGMITFPSPHAYQDFERDTCHFQASADPSTSLHIDTSIGRVIQEDSYHDHDSFTSPYTRMDTTTDQYTLGLRYDTASVSIRPAFTYLGEGIHHNITGHKGRHTRSGLLSLNAWPGPFEIITTSRYDNNSDFESEWTFRAGLGLEIFDWLRIKANAGEGYRLPTFYELYSSQGFVTGNPLLKPENSSSFDIGPSLETDRFGLSINWFRHDYDKLIVYILQSGFYYKPYNISESKATGIELHAWSEPFDFLRISGNYTFNKAIDTTGEPNRDKNQIPGIPRNTANIQVDLHREFGKMDLGMYASYSYTEGNFVTRSNTKKLDDRNIYNLGFNIAPTKNISINAEIKNLTDERVLDLRGFPLEGRSFYLTINASM